MTPIELMAIVVAVLMGTKIAVILIEPKRWEIVVNKFYAYPVLTIIISFLLAIAALKFLLAELTIIQIFAVMFFLMLLMVLGVATYSKEMKGLAHRVYKDTTLVKRGWLAIIIWILLILWLLAALFKVI